jgi:hypothetical protein
VFVDLDSDCIRIPLALDQSLDPDLDFDSEKNRIRIRNIISGIVKYSIVIPILFFYVLFFSPEDFLVWKKVQQHLENMSSQASLGKNKWDLVSSYVDSVKVSRQLFVPPTIRPDPELFPF